MAAGMRADDKVFLIGEEVAQYQGAYKISQGLLDEFGAKRVIDTPITEHGFTGLSVGAALNGLRPIVELMTFNFAMQAMDQIINSAAKTLYMLGGQMGCPIRRSAPQRRRVARGRPTLPMLRQLYAQISLGLRSCPPGRRPTRRVCCARRSAIPTRSSELENESGPARHLTARPIRDFVVPIGKAKVERSGTHVTIVAFSIMVGVAMKAAEALAAEGIEAEVVNLRSLRPMDTDTIVASVKNSNRLVTVEEGWPSAGIGAEVVMRVIDNVFDWLDAPPVPVTWGGCTAALCAQSGKLALPQPEWVVDAVKKLI